MTAWRWPQTFAQAAGRQPGFSHRENDEIVRASRLPGPSFRVQIGRQGFPIGPPARWSGLRMGW